MPFRKGQVAWNFKDITNIKFHRLIVIKYSHTKNNQAYWLCRCDCGKEKIIWGNDLRQNKIKSCGCWNKEQATKRGKENKRHGMEGTKFYRVWNGLKQRCLNKNGKDYKNYGGRGITVCSHWLKFENFRDDMLESYKKHVAEFGEKQTSIDRMNNNGNYEPNNCRWATVKEQRNNQRKKNV